MPSATSKPFSVRPLAESPSIAASLFFDLSLLRMNRRAACIERRGGFVPHLSPSAADYNEIERNEKEQRGT